MNGKGRRGRAESKSAEGSLTSVRTLVHIYIYVCIKVVVVRNVKQGTEEEEENSERR